MTESENEYELASPEDQKFIGTVIEWFDELMKSLFKLLPEDCILKMRNALDIRMLFVLNSNMIKHKLIGREDICLFCTVDICPWNNKVSYRFWRYFKVRLLNGLLPSNFSKLIKTITR